MNALSRLRAAEFSRRTADTEPTKPTKPPFDGFVGDVRTAFANSLDSSDGTDPGVLRRRSRLLTMLSADPGLRVAAVTEASDPSTIAVAIRGVAVGEIDVRNWDPIELLRLMEFHGAVSTLVHQHGHR
jgi:hypothetical protein